MQIIKVRPGTRLDQLLKLINIASTGGEAKIIIQEGGALVNDKVEIRRGYKLKEGDIVKIGDTAIRVSLTG